MEPLAIEVVEAGVLLKRHLDLALCQFTDAYLTHHVICVRDSLGSRTRLVNRVYPLTTQRV